MGLFDSVKKIGNILAPENTHPTTGNGQPNSEILANSTITSNAKDERLARLRAAMAKQVTENSSATTNTREVAIIPKPEQTTLTQPTVEVPNTIPTAIVVEKSPEETEVSPQPVLATVIPEVEIPKIETTPDTPEQKITEPTPVNSAPENTLQKKDLEVAPSTDIETTLMEKLTGRELVEEFLKEVQSLISAGKDLSELMEKRNSTSIAKKEELDNLNIILNDANGIKSAMEALLSAESNEITKQKLLDSLKIYGEYIEAHINEIRATENTARKEDSTLLVTLNAQKSTIDKLTKLIGGKENFDSLRIYIKGFERVAGKKISSTFSDEAFKKTKSKELVMETVFSVLNFVKKDLPIAKEMTQRGDLMSILLAVFQTKLEETKNINK